MLTPAMVDLIATYTIGCVATVRADGSAAVSPKATFLVVNERTIAFANIRSPGTIENLRRRPNVEVNFIDVFARKACRVVGSGRYLSREDAEPALRRRFDEKWPDLYDAMKGFVLIDLTEAEALTSPSYDFGAEASRLSEHWLRYYAEKLGFTVTKNAGAG